MKNLMIHVGDTIRFDTSLLRFIDERPHHLGQPVIVREIRQEPDGAKRLVLIVATDHLERTDG